MSPRILPCVAGSIRLDSLARRSCTRCQKATRLATDSGVSIEPRPAHLAADAAGFHDADLKPIGRGAEPGKHAPPAEDATPKIAAFGDQARRALHPATPAHGACHDRNAPHEAPGTNMGQCPPVGNSAPRRMRRSSPPPPGTCAVSSRVQGITNSSSARWGAVCARPRTGSRACTRH
jgi:hypothetical protein